MKYKMKLQAQPFNKIKNGSKIIELRLLDEKRQLLKEKDIIEFTNIKTQEKIETEIVFLHKFANFEELYKHFDKELMGYNKDEEAKANDMELYYSKEEQQKYGVVGIEIRLIKN